MKKAEFIIFGKNVISLDSENPSPQAAAVSGGVIFATGTREEMTALLDSGTEVLEVPDGATVLPGLKDSHLHLTSTGHFLGLVNLKGADSVEEILRRYREFQLKNAVGPGEWLIGRGWNQAVMREGRFLTKEDFDAAFPENPLIATRVCHHASVLNSAALSACGLTEDTPDPAGGKLGRKATGELTGVLFERATDIAASKAQSESTRNLELWLERGIQHALSAGLTEAHSDDLAMFGSFPKLVEAYLNLKKRGKQPLHVEMELICTSLKSVEKLLSEIKATVIPEEGLRASNIKILFDGSLGARTAAMEEDYSDAPGERGMLNLEPDELFKMVEAAHMAEMPVAVHAIGDRAAAIAADAIASAVDKKPDKSIRHRIVHLQTASESTYEKIRKYGIVADIQPKFVPTDMLVADARFGAERIKRSYVWKSLRKKGIHTAGGSDSPVEPLHPLLGMNAAITRADLSGLPEGGWYPEECLSPEEALSLFTEGVAYAASAENTRGRIAIGYKADFTVVRGNYMADPVGVTKDNTVLMTIIGGKVVYRLD